MNVVHDQILSLCSGIGGLDLGLSAGLRRVGRSPRTVCMVEREAFAIANLAHAMQEGRLDECPLWLGDLKDLPLQELPEIDWITGGYPCQPFSQAGKRMGGEDPRHLWPHILRLTESLRPSGVFFENVSGHLSLGLDQVLRDLEECGFRSAFGLYSAAEVGAPHRRERVFILGLADRNRRRLEELRSPHHHNRRDEGRHDLGRCDQGVAHPDNSRLNQQRGSCSSEQERSGTKSHSWPAGPGQSQLSYEPPRTLEPSLGRDADGIRNRVDRLRALGNAVVPQQAEHAFVDLWYQLNNSQWRTAV